MPKEPLKGTKYLCENMSFSAQEAMKKLRTNTMIALPNNNSCKVIGLTSTQPKEGKSFTTINLAYTFAQMGKKVMLLDADIRRPTIVEKLKLQTSVGLGELLTDNNDISQAIQHYTDSKGQYGFDVIGGVRTYDNASELLLSNRFPAFLDTLRKAYDILLIDLPPVEAVTDAVIVGKQTDGVIIVVRENRIPRKQFDKCLRQLDYADINILGVVFNGSVEGTGKKYSYGSYGSYGYNKYY